MCVYLLASWQLLALICYDASSVFAVVVMAAVAVAALGFILCRRRKFFHARWLRERVATDCEASLVDAGRESAKTTKLLVRVVLATD